MFGTRPARPSRVRGLPAIAGARSLAELADEITTPGEGQIRALICNSGNPVLSGAQGARLDGALAGLDLMVAVDLVQRESHRHAHWLLPAAHYLEREDLLSVYSSFEDQPFVQFAQAALEPPSGVRQEWTFWRDLALALDIPIFGPQTASMTPRHLWESIVDGGGRLSWGELMAAPHGVIYGAKAYGQLESAIATPDEAVHLAPEAFVARLRQLLAVPAADVCSEWPLLLSNQRRKSAMNSWLNDTPTALRRNPTNTLLLHPDDAAPLGIQTGDAVRVSSPVHALECTAEVSETPQAGVAVLDHGWGSRSFDPPNGEPLETLGSNRNALVSDQEVDVLSGTPSFGIARVRVERLTTAAEGR
jgi:formate dehydrogenase